MAKPDKKNIETTSQVGAAPTQSYRIPTPAAEGTKFSVSPVFGFLFARKGNGITGLYRIVTDPDGNVIEMREVITAGTRMVMKALILSVRKINLDGTFRTGILEKFMPLLTKKPSEGK